MPFNSNNGQASASAACLPAACPSHRGCGCLQRGQEPPPAPESVGQGSAFPCARGSAPPQRRQGPPSHRPCSAGLPWAPSCFVPGQGCARCWPGLLGSPGACAAPALPAPCPCWAEPGVPAAAAPSAPLPPDVPCPHLVTIRSAPRWRPLPAPPAPAAPSPRAGDRCREPLRRPLLHTGAVARAPTHPVPAPAPACCRRSRRPGATGLFFYNNFLVHSNFFL